MSVPEGVFHYLVDRANACAACPLSDNQKVIYRSNAILPELSSFNPDPVDLLFVGDAPSTTDYIQKKPFSDEPGKLFLDILQECIGNRFSYFITNCVLCMPWTDKQMKANFRPPSAKECKTCSGLHLAAWIGAFQPLHIFALGKIAERTLKSLNIKAHTLPHPNTIYYSNHQELEIARFTVNLKDILNA